MVSPADRRLPDGDAQGGCLRHEHVDARAEADQPKTLADADIGACFGPADDAARHQPGDLHGNDSAVRALDHQPVALVLAACLVELGVEELAGAVLDPGDAATHRRAVHMAGKDVHEHRDAGHLDIAQPQLARRHGWPDRRDHAVGGADHQPVVDRRDALGIAEEVSAPRGRDEADPEQRGREQAEQYRRAAERCDEWPSFAMDRNQRFADRVDEAHCQGAPQFLIAGCLADIVRSRNATGMKRLTPPACGGARRRRTHRPRGQCAGAPRPRSPRAGGSTSRHRGRFPPSRP